MAEKYYFNKSRGIMKIGIVGGGFMGLTLAHEIAKTNVTVKVFESAAQMGGLSTH